MADVPKNEPGPSAEVKATDPRAAAVTFVTTEHFVLQGGRASTIAESTGRATMFVGAVSGGLVALGLVATASRVGPAFYAFGLVLLPTLSFVGFVTFERALQSGIEDYQYARRIALLREYYFDNAPELAAYLYSLPPSERPLGDAASTGRRQGFRSVAGMIGVITSVLAGSAVALVAVVVFDHSLAAALIAGIAGALVTLSGLTQNGRRIWLQGTSAPVTQEGSNDAPAEAP